MRICTKRLERIREGDKQIARKRAIEPPQRMPLTQKHSKKSIAKTF